MEPGLRVSLERTQIEWATEKPTLYSARHSPDFAVRNTRCHLEAFCGYGEKYVLFLRSDGPSPFHVTTSLSAAGAGQLLTQAEAVADPGEHCVWVCKKAQILKVLPDFGHQRLCCFTVVFDFTQDCKVHPAAGEPFYRTRSTSGARFGLDSLRHDLENLLTSGQSTGDVELKCGQRTFRAHGCLLGARSDVFRTMLDSDMLEGKTGRVEIRDTEPDVLELFLRYLYTAELPEVTTEEAEQLYEVADRFNIGALKVQCGCFLKESLTPESVFDVMALADRHSDSDLKESTVAYMLDQKIPLEGDPWTSFCSSHPVLSNEVLSRFCQSVVSSK